MNYINDEQEYAIEITNLNKWYGDNQVLKDVSFKVKKGSIHGFIGPNGAGKTTTMNAIMGLLNFSKGNIKIEGKDNKLDPFFNLNLGYLPSESIFPDIIVQKYVNLCGYLRSIPKEIISERFNKSALFQYKDRACKLLSTGYKKISQLFVIGLGLFFSKSKILILDEPTAGIDPSNRAILFKQLKELQEKEGATILLSTHVLHDLQQLADSITMIRDGAIVYDGPKTEDIEETYNLHYLKGDKTSYI